MSLFHSPRWFRQFLYPVKGFMLSMGHLNTKHCQPERMDLLFLWSGLWLSLYQLLITFLSTQSHIKQLFCLGWYFSWVFCSSFVLVTSVYGVKVRKRNIALLQQNRAASQNQRLTKTLLFVSTISVLSWLRLVIVNYLTFFRRVDIPNVFEDIINILNFSNSILNPFIYALRIPQFRQTLVLCCSRHQAVMNGKRISSKFFIWRLKMYTSIFSLVIMRFLVVHDHTLRWRMKDAHRDEVTRHAWGGGPVGQAGVRTFPDIFENGEFFFFRFSLSSTRKTVLSGRNAVFQKRSPEWRFF